MQKVTVIFGASGFIGTHFIRRLKAQGYDHVVAVDIAPPREKLPSVTYLTADVRDLSTFVVDGEVETIINLAAVHVTPGHPDPAYYETNVLGASEITSFARRKNAKTIIFTSSISVYGPAEESKTEAAPLAPISAYGWSKLLAEKIHKSWLEEDTARRLIICRPAVIFGQGEGGNFTRLAKLLKKGIFVFPGRTNTVKSCFYVKDLIDAFMYAVQKGDRFVLFNGCYAERTTIADIVGAFKQGPFPNVYTFVLPRIVLLAVANLLKPFSFFGLGIHPDRVMKLVQSTNIVPEWLGANRPSHPGRLAEALEDWGAESAGRFD